MWKYLMLNSSCGIFANTVGIYQDLNLIMIYQVHHCEMYITGKQPTSMFNCY